MPEVLWCGASVLITFHYMLMCSRTKPSSKLVDTSPTVQALEHVDVVHTCVTSVLCGAIVVVGSMRGPCSQSWETNAF